MSKRTSEGGNNAEVVRVWLLGGIRVSVGSRTIGEDHWQCRKAAARHSRDPAAYWAAIDLYAGELLPEDRDEEWTEECRRRLREMHLSLLLGVAPSGGARGP
jgi:DNA-binding SARP family transcriptional activator